MAKRRLIHPKANEKSTKPKGDLGAAWHSFARGHFTFVAT
jgi:hypothetical protein